MTATGTSFRERAAADAAALLSGTNSELSESITYHVSGGADLTIDAVVVRRPAEPNSVREGLGVVYMATVRIQTADVASPGWRDSVTIDGFVWGIRDIDAATGASGTVLLLVSRVEQIEVGNPERRRRRA